jgi:hypothetical protein
MKLISQAQWVLLSPFCGITKEMMSRGPHVAYMEYREIT